MKETANHTKEQKKTLQPYVIPEVISVVEDLDLSATYSYANYLRWELEERLELIKGKIFKMAAPTTLHQRVVGRIYGELYHFLKKQKCEVLVSPFDVRFPSQSIADDAVFTVLQPDICVVCDSKKLDSRGCLGAPDLVVEIISPSTRKKDRVTKFDVYEKFKVKEYWIVEPTQKCILKYTLNTSGLYGSNQPYGVKDQLTSNILPGFQLSVNEILN